MEGNIFITGEIISEEERDPNSKVQQYTYSDALAAYQRTKDSDVINLWLATPGGYVKEGTAIAELFEKSGKLIKTHNIGDVASIGMDIFLTARKENRFYYPLKGRLLIHYPWGEAMGNADEFKEYSEELKQEENKLVKNMSKKLGVEEVVLRGYMQQDRYLTEDEVELLNIANIVKTEFKAVAKFKNQNMNEVEVKKELGVIKGMFEEIKKLFKPKALIIQDVNGAQIDLPEIETIDQLTVGLAATIDGVAAEGESTLDDGTVIKYEDGFTSEIILPSDGNEELEALKAENESLKKRIEETQLSLKAKEAEVETVQTETKAELEKVEARFKEFQAKFSTEFIPAGGLDGDDPKIKPNKFEYKGKKHKKE